MDSLTNLQTTHLLLSLKQLDRITLSKLEWKETLKQYLKILNKNIKEVEDKSMTEVIDKVNEYSQKFLKEKMSKMF